MSYGVPGFEGTRLMHINRRKNNTQRKGHYPRSAAHVSWSGRGASYDAESADVGLGLLRCADVSSRAGFHGQ